MKMYNIPHQKDLTVLSEGCQICRHQGSLRPVAGRKTNYNSIEIETFFYK